MSHTMRSAPTAPLPRTAGGTATDATLEQLLLAVAGLFIIGTAALSMMLSSYVPGLGLALGTLLLVLAQRATRDREARGLAPVLLTLASGALLVGVISLLRGLS